MKKLVLLLISLCILALALSGASSAAYTANNPNIQTINVLDNGYYSNSIETKSNDKNVTVKPVSVGHSVLEPKKIISNGVNTKSKVYLRVLQSTGFNSDHVFVYDKFIVYQKPENNAKWCRYLFNRIVTASKPGVKGPEDNYRIYQLQNIDLTKDNPSYYPNITDLNVEDLTTTGNWEKAVQIRSQD